MRTNNGTTSSRYLSLDAFSGLQISGALAREDDISDEGYRRLAEFRHHIRQFLHVGEEAARATGIEPQQHQLLLAIKGLLKGNRATVTTLAQQLRLRHNTTVELVNRLVDEGAVRRRHGNKDRREVLVELTATGETLLHQLSALHWEELHVSGPAFCVSLCDVMLQPHRERRRDG